MYGGVLRGPRTRLAAGQAESSLRGGAERASASAPSAPKTFPKASSPPASSKGLTAATGEIIFTLRRCSQGAVRGCGIEHQMPRTIRLRAGCRQLMLGRSTSCDVTLPLHVLSKNHAQFHVQGAAEGGHMLMLEDKSSNGTWVNGERIPPKRLVQVEVGDRISFLPPSASVPDMEPLAYDLLAGDGGYIDDAPKVATGVGNGSFATAGAEGSDVISWLRSWDQGDLRQYDEMLRVTYDGLQQLSDSYSGRIDDFFADVRIEPKHQPMFRRALEELVACGHPVKKTPLRYDTAALTT